MMEQFIEIQFFNPPQTLIFTGTLSSTDASPHAKLAYSIIKKQIGKKYPNKGVVGRVLLFATKGAFGR